MKYLLTKFQNFILFFSSEDVYVIRRYLELKEENKEYRIKYYFFIIGFTVLSFFIWAALSTIFFIYNIFDGYSRLLSLPIGIFVGLLIANIYLFLLYTITPTILDTVDRKKKGNSNLKSIKNTQKDTSMFSFSFLFRLGFIAFIGLMIAQPLNVWLLIDINLFGIGKKEIIQVERYKSQSLVESYLTNDDHYTKAEILLFQDIREKLYYVQKEQSNVLSIQSTINTINQKVKADQNAVHRLKMFRIKLNDVNANFLQKKYNYQETKLLIRQINNFIEESSQSDRQFLEKLSEIKQKSYLHQDVFNFYLQHAIPLMKEKIESHDQLKRLLDRNTLYTLKIKLLMADNPLALILSLVIILVFCIPVFAKFVIRNKFNYYKFRAGSEKAVIIKLYESHRAQYSKILYVKLKTQLENSNQYLYQKLTSLATNDTPSYILKKSELDLRTENIAVEKFEYWDDAPFRTQRKSELSHASKEDLIKQFYS